MSSRCKKTKIFSGILLHNPPPKLHHETVAQHSKCQSVKMPDHDISVESVKSNIFAMWHILQIYLFIYFICFIWFGYFFLSFRHFHIFYLVWCWWINILVVFFYFILDYLQYSTSKFLSQLNLNLVLTRLQSQQPCSMLLSCCSIRISSFDIIYRTLLHNHHFQISDLC